MPRYEVETAETIQALRRKVHRDDHDEFTFGPTARGTNRGNKLKRKARYIWRGGLASMSGVHMAREQVEHAGYRRFILSLNPPRVNVEGDELDDSETDEEADVMAAEMNPYSTIDLTETLGPLKHPSELLTHPSLSHPYLSEALPNQVKDTREKLRQEQDILWKVKELGRHFTGDAPFMPCADTEMPDGISLFAPPMWPVKSKKRKRDDHNSTTASLTEAASLNGGAQAASIASVDKDIEAPMKAELIGKPNGNSDKHSAPAENGEDVLQGLTNGNIDHSEKAAQTNGVAVNGDSTICSDTTNGNNKTRDDDMPEAQKISSKSGAMKDTSADDTLVDTEKQNQSTEQKADNDPANVSERTPSPQPPPPRRITRALAQNHNTSANHSTHPSPPASPSTTSSSPPPSINPVFSFPPQFQISTTYGLPANEAVETRRLLSSYIQKQEETVRGYQELLHKLLKAQRLRKTVMVWCKAEGHVGEMSDGEDWIDTVYWGLGPGELKKGRDEDGDYGGDEDEVNRGHGGGVHHHGGRGGHGRDGGGRGEGGEHRERGGKKGKRRRG